MAVHQAGQHDHAGQVENDQIRIGDLRAQAGADRLDHRPVEQDVAAGQVTELRIHGQHRRAAQQDAAAARGPQQLVAQAGQGAFVPVVVRLRRTGRVAHRGSSHSCGTTGHSRGIPVDSRMMMLGGRVRDTGIWSGDWMAVTAISPTSRPSSWPCSRTVVSGGDTRSTWGESL